MHVFKALLAVFVATIAAIDAAIIAGRIATGEWKFIGFTLETAWPMVVVLNAMGLLIAYILGRLAPRKPQ